MKNMFLELETKMWECAKNADAEGFAGLVAADAVMVCGGYRCSGAEYAGFIGDFGISAYEIIGFETVLETEDTVQTHYVVATTAASEEYADIAGKFHVTTTWRKRGEWMVVFNMDSRIYEIQEG